MTAERRPGRGGDPDDCTSVERLPDGGDSAADDRATTHGAWCELVRRARLGPRLKASALVVASYASADGTGIFCGVARLALDAEIGYSTARRHLARLRELCLIECTARHRQRGRSDEYRLTFPPDLLAHVKVPDPAEYREMAHQLREKAARTAQPMSRTAGQGTSRRTAQDVSRTSPRTAHLGLAYSSRREPPPFIYSPRLKEDHPSAVVQEEVRQLAAADVRLTTRQGTDQERRRQAEALRQWQQQQGEAS